jgi:hypothetical protein
VKNAIVEKLRDVLTSGINSECKVVYVLCEARKLLDALRPAPVPFALRLYCNWALHVDLDHSNTTLPFLQRVDDFVNSVFAGAEGNPALEYQVFSEFVFLDSFRNQFKQFLAEHALPTALCDQDALWHQFVTHYAGIIEDGSLSCDGKKLPLRWVREVTFTKGNAREDGYIPFDLTWQIDLLDGRAIVVDVYASDFPAGGKMIFHGMKIIKNITLGGTGE